MPSVFSVDTVANVTEFILLQPLTMSKIKSLWKQNIYKNKNPKKEEKKEETRKEKGKKITELQSVWKITQK